MSKKNSDGTLLKVGLAGTALAALCCFKPVLVLLLGALGLSAWVGSLDTFLMSTLVIFIAIAVFAGIRATRQKNRASTCCESPTKGVKR